MEGASRGGNMEEVSRHLDEASGRHLEPSGRHLGGISEAPGSHLRGTWEALSRLGGQGRLKGVLEAKVIKTITFFHRKLRDPAFRVVNWRATQS